MRPRAPYIRDSDYLEYVRHLPCLIGCEGAADPAHVRTKRLGGDRGNVVPLCHGHHVEQHQHGIKTFARKYNVDLKVLALDVLTGYLAYKKIVPSEEFPE